MRSAVETGEIDSGEIDSGEIDLGPESIWDEKKDDNRLGRKSEENRKTCVAGDCAVDAGVFNRCGETAV